MSVTTRGHLYSSAALIGPRRLDVQAVTRRKYRGGITQSVARNHNDHRLQWFESSKTFISIARDVGKGKYAGVISYPVLPNPLPLQF